MPTINIDINWPDHPKTKRLIRAAGESAPFRLIALWCYAAKYHRVDGDLSGYSNDDLEGIAGWTGKNGVFASALKSSGYLDDDMKLHDWEEHEGHLEVYHTKSKKMNAARLNRLSSRQHQDNYKNSTTTPNARHGNDILGAASPPNDSRQKPEPLGDKEFFGDCVNELRTAIKGWYSSISDTTAGKMAGRAVKKLNRVVKVHPGAFVWLVEHKMRVPTDPAEWYRFVNTADATMHKDGKYPDGKPRPPLCHEWASEARMNSPIIPRVENAQS